MQHTQPQGLLPILTLKNTVIFPGMTQVIKVGRPLSIAALKKAEKNGYWIVAVQQKHKDEQTQIDPEDLYHTGTLCRIDSMKGSVENGFQVILQGFTRVGLNEPHIHKKENYIEADCTTLHDIKDVNAATENTLLESLKELSMSILRLLPANTEQVSEMLTGVTDLSYLTSLAATHLDISLDRKQELLETLNLKDRTLKLLNHMQEFRESLQVQNEIRGKLNQKLGQFQRQTILREQLKAIREELGEGPEQNKEDVMRKKIEDAGMPEDVKKMAFSEADRLQEIGPQSPETHIIRNYIELLCSLPWSKTSEDKEIDLVEARRQLNEDHYGLEKVKTRIIQHLAVMKLKKNMKGSILLLVGPPGVGKTSLGQSIAKTLGRKFARVSLGGVRDDAEIRGHRRTYIGAMPGRIIQGLKKAGENNPVFLLDEVDKLSRAFNGDPAAALLETLDPEQNSTFLDHYLDVGFDLSKVFFIATANSLDTIPGPLLDRMEVIEMGGYTTSEKLHIAKTHLLPKVQEELGVSNEQIQVSDDALMRLISTYTREAGVRDLQRKITSVLRAMSEKVLESKSLPLKVTALDLEELIGSDRFQYEVSDLQTQPGVATGLAWTPVGGDLLFIESTQMPGKGQLIMTGQLGDVMKESAQIALSLVRSNIPILGLQGDLSKIDIHLHVPSGAIPKDGPSAGVTMVTSIASLLTKRPVAPRLAMTGEVTLRGLVLPVGGIKEKVIAAHRGGVKEVLLPLKNKRDLKDIPEEVRNEMKFTFIENTQQLLKAALDLDSTDFGINAGISFDPRGFDSGVTSF